MYNPTPVVARILERVLKERRTKNGSYSLRAFARDIGIKPGPLSDMMAGKRPVSPTTANIIARRLNLSQTDITMIQKNAIDGRRRTDKGKQPHGAPHFTLIPDDQFAIIADWHHFAILSLIKTDDFKSRVDWIAARLGLTKRAVSQAINRLVAAGYIKYAGKKLVRREERYHTTHGVPSAALREAHRQNLTQAAEALEQVPLALRDITSMTMAIDPERLPLAKELMQEFRWRFLKIMEQNSKTEVYNLNIQFYPVSKVRSEHILPLLSKEKDDEK